MVAEKGMHELSLRRSMFIAVVCTLLGSSAWAAVEPNSMFSDNAVLQQGIEIPVWGTACDGERVTVSIASQKATTTAENGKWVVKLPPMKAGGPYTMTFSGSNTVEIKNVLVGEVWVCSGQSNMQFGLNSAANAEDALAEAANPMIRLAQVPNIMSSKPIADAGISWAECSRDTAASFSAVGYFFGKKLSENLKVPVGLINASWGGTTVQAWTARRAVLNYWDYWKLVHSYPGAEDSPNRPSVLYNAMIAPIIPFGIRGAIWYQGESNAGWAYAYRKDFPALIRNWRDDWGQGDFPFLFVQIAPFAEPMEGTWAELREAQLLTSLTVPNTGMAVITDYGDPVMIHPIQKKPVGERLARIALAKTYGKDIVYSGPLYKAMKVNGSEAVISFDHIDGGLEAHGEELTGFTVAGADRKFHTASARVEGGTVVVSSPNVAKPIAVRFGWANCPVVNLFNSAGLPASPFRTDDFPGVTQPRK